jgi:hypothetical protein
MKNLYCLIMYLGASIGVIASTIVEGLSVWQITIYFLLYAIVLKE